MNKRILSVLLTTLLVVTSLFTIPAKAETFVNPVLTGRPSFTNNPQFSGAVRWVDYANSETRVFQTAISATTSPKLVVFTAPRNVTITAIKVTVGTTLSTSDTDYWTFALTNETASKSLLKSDDLNTTKATGGIGTLTAFTYSSFTLTTTTANLNLAKGDLCTITATKSASASNLVGLTVRIEYKDR